MPELEMAARVGDVIAHSPLLGIALTGIAVGLVVGAVLVALTIATGGADVLVGGAIFAEGATVAATAGAIVLAIGEALGLASTMLTVTSLFYGFGKSIGSWFSAAIPTGNITAGAGTVFIGSGLPAAARYTDPIKCQEPATTYMGAMTLGSIICPGVGTLIAAAIVYAYSSHDGATIAQGSKTVLTEGKSQSRVGDKTTCGGTIKNGCETVFIGGPPNAEVSALAEMPGVVEDVMGWVDSIGVWTGMASGLIGLFKSGKIAEKLMEFGLAGIDFGLWGAQKLLESDAREADRTGHHEEAEEDREFAERLETTRTWYERGLMVRVGLKGIGGREEEELPSILGGHE